MTAPAPSSRRWFRYSLRTFLIVVTVAGLALGLGAPSLVAKYRDWQTRRLLDEAWG